MTAPEAVFLFVAELLSTVTEGANQVWQYFTGSAATLGELAGQRRRRVMKYGVWGGLLLCLLLAGGFFVSSYRYYANWVDARLASGYAQSRAGLYAAPRTLRVGQGITKEHLLAALQRAGYAEHTASGVWSGSYAVQNDTITLHPRPEEEENNPETVVIKLTNAHIESIYCDGGLFETYRLEPEVLAYDVGGKSATRRPLTYQEIPPHLRTAIVAIEDQRFFAHRGVDWRGVGRAFWHNLWGSGRQGGSTITQQLIKNTYLSPERTLQRKFAEAMLAIALERRLSKEDIFALYCNEIYLGQRGVTAVYGVAQAAQIFFGKELSQLTLAESATIAGMIQSPKRYAPDRRPDAAQSRRNTVLAALLRDHAANRPEIENALREPLVVVPAYRQTATFAPYFVDYVNRAVSAKLEATPTEDERSLRIYTTLDPDLQTIAENALQRQLAKLDQAYPGQKPQAALVALDAKTGHVLAMVGGRDYQTSQLNRATDALRQPGSAFKPVVYAAALEKGLSPLEQYQDAPREFVYQEAGYRPANYNDIYTNRPASMRDALVNSLNVVTVDVALRTGLDQVAEVSNRLGLPQKNLFPALALGATETTPLALASAYTAFAQDGKRAAPSVVARAFDARGNDIFDTENAPAQALTPATAYMITHLLADAASEGTARQARAAIDSKVAIAGKTGTSRDGWFVGYTPNLVCAVWIGFDDNSQLGLTGAEAALPAWIDFIKETTQLNHEFGGETFPRPENVRLFKIDLDTNKLANGYCARRVEMALLPDQVPDDECTQHSKDSLLAEIDANKAPLMLPSTPTGSAAPLPDGLPPPVNDAPRPAPEATEPPVKTTIVPVAVAPKPAATTPSAPPPGRVAPPPKVPALVLSPPVLRTQKRNVSPKELSQHGN